LGERLERNINSSTFDALSEYQSGSIISEDESTSEKLQGKEI
jgi:hypothetical protein